MKTAYPQDCLNQGFRDRLRCGNRRGFSNITEIGKSYAVQFGFSCGKRIVGARVSSFLWQLSPCFSSGERLVRLPATCPCRDGPKGRSGLHTSRAEPLCPRIKTSAVSDHYIQIRAISSGDLRSASLPMKNLTTADESLPRLAGPHAQFFRTTLVAFLPRFLASTSFLR